MHRAKLISIKKCLFLPFYEFLRMDEPFSQGGLHFDYVGNIMRQIQHMKFCTSNSSWRYVTNKELLINDININ